MMKLTIVIPVYNGAMTISGLVDELIKDLEMYHLEIILVNDGSIDDSHRVCASIFNRHKNIVKYIGLAKNFGEHNAVMAGLSRAMGDYTVVIDDDFQNPPSEIRKLIDEAVSGGFDVVYSFYEKKHHSPFRNLGSAFNNLVASLLLDKPRELYLSSFKCMNRFIVQELIKYKGPFPYIDGLILRSTRKIGKVMVKHADRKEGKSGYTLKKLVKLWLNMFVNFSVLPLRISTFLGFLFLILGMVSSIYIIFERILNPDLPVGFASILVAILVFGGTQLLMLGMIGEYLGKLFLSNNQTPQYVIREEHG
ncbi:MAG: glycosyltransferase family 2 protein [Candidatus Omnitrophota bacterium]|nr:MAG: glycosyltransferase family 2 protein [Candidatus Omnitrophota bacterium]